MHYNSPRQRDLKCFSKCSNSLSWVMAKDVPKHRLSKTWRKITTFSGNLLSATYTDWILLIAKRRGLRAGRNEAWLTVAIAIKEMIKAAYSPIWKKDRILLSPLVFSRIRQRITPIFFRNFPENSVFQITNRPDPGKLAGLFSGLACRNVTCKRHKFLPFLKRPLRTQLEAVVE